MRILMVCIHDWAGAAYALAQAVNEHTKHLARVVVFESTWLGYPCDVLAPNAVEFWALLDWADVLNVYGNAQMSLPEEMLGKPIVKSYLGSDYRNGWEQFNRQDAAHSWPQTCTTMDLSLYGPTWLPFPMAAIHGREPDDEPFTVCHAPTNRIKKGTSMVVEALDGLDGIKLDLLERMPHAQCMERKARAHVLIDQVGPRALGYGCNAVEAWALGMPVISDGPDTVCEALEKRAGALPFYRASTAEQIRSAVERLRDEPSFFAEWSDWGRTYLRRWHDPSSIANQFAEICRRAKDRPDYHPRSYWERRGNNHEEADCPEELNNLDVWLQSIRPENILEVGSGWGRIYQRWQALDLSGTFTMCDFAKSMMDGCERETGVRPEEWDGETLPYPDGSFDFVLSFSVMLHVPPEDAKAMLTEHARVTNRWLFVATLDSYDDQLSPHCFVHDYGALFRESGLAVAEERKFGNRIHWLLRGAD